MHGHDRHNTAILSVIHNMSTTCTNKFPILATSRPWPVADTQATYYICRATKAHRCESQLPLLLAAITAPRYQSASTSSLRHPTDTSSNNGEFFDPIAGNYYYYYYYYYYYSIWASLVTGLFCLVLLLNQL